MLAKIQRNQIHHFKAVEDGVEKDYLELGIKFTEYPDTPTYGIRADVTGVTTKAQLKAILKTEILALVDKVGEQIQRDGVARGHFDDWGWADTEFETDNL